MFKNPFKKTPPSPEPKSTSLLDALGVTSPYRTQEAKALLPVKNKIKKPYKASALSYALVSFVSCVMSGVASDVTHRYIPWSNAAPWSICIAFMFLAVFCGFQATDKWKH